MADWLVVGLAKAGLPVVCIEAYHASRVLKARLNKTDRNDAQGIAELMRVGLFRSVHIKTPESRWIRNLLAARRLLQIKAIDLENAIKALLRLEGVRLGRGNTVAFSKQALELGSSSPSLMLLQSLLTARNAIREQFNQLSATVRLVAQDDPVCRRLMTAPGVGPIVALAYRSAIDVPERFRRSRTVAAHLGLTPVTHQSGEVDRRGRISRCGDEMARRCLVNAAISILSPRARPTGLKVWGAAVCERRGKMKGYIALARRLAVILHRMWINETDFDPMILPA